MKTGKSPDGAELTPSKKKLKQARLPFKLISECSSTPVTPTTRKRKLSATDAESITKIGKLSKENDLVEDLVVISDDSQDGQNQKTSEKPLNPYVKLVDTVLKKKLQKTKPKKKKNHKKSIKQVNGSIELNESIVDTGSDCEVMDVDTPSETELNNENNLVGSEKCSTQKEAEKEESQEKLPCPVTPKRSTRSNSIIEKNNNSKDSPLSEKLNKSLDSALSTPKQNRSSSVTSSQADESLNKSSTTTNLTPKQLQKKIESAKKKEEREKDKQEKELKRQQEKEERAKQKQEKEEQRKREREEKEEAKKREREEKEELKKKEREERERQKELERKMKEEKEELRKKEREEKEEQRRKEREAREEDRKKKQEALEQEKLDQELKKKKAAEAFVNFFVPKQKTEKDQPTMGPVSKNSMLSSFTIKVDMRLAPIVRNDLSKEGKQKMDDLLVEQDSSKHKLYLHSLKERVRNPMSSGKTWPLTDKDDDDDDDVMIVEDALPPIDGAGEIFTCESAVREKMRPKLLSFHENRRPPYWGTWRKTSLAIKPRKPFGQDEKQLDYEVDSDEEWEEEQEGESIDGSAAGSDDEQGPDEYEVDNELFVPHGYLSDEEATMDEDDVLSLSPEAQKAKLKHLEDEFESEMKKPTEKLKPRMYGILWENSDGGKPEKCVDALWDYFGKFAMIMSDLTPHLQPSTGPEEPEKKKVKKKKTPEGENKSPKVDKKKKSKSENKKPKVLQADKNNTPDAKKTQPGINTFLTKLKSQ